MALCIHYKRIVISTCTELAIALLFHKFNHKSLKSP